MKKRTIAIVTALMVLLSLSACSTEVKKVSVQRADQLSAAATAGQRYAGMVITEDVVKIQKDSNKTVLECHVSTGDRVSAGDPLFSYDSASLELDLEKRQLEIQKMRNEQQAYTDQQAQLEKQLENTSDESDQIRLTLEINTLKIQLMEVQFQLAAKEKEIENLKTTMENTDVVSPVDGIVRQVDDQGQSDAYITIQQSGAFRIKGQLNELSMNGGIMAGTRVRVISRIDPAQTWTGTVSGIDTESQSSESADGLITNDMVGPMGQSSTYNFYVEPDATDGLLLGQHVYMVVDTELSGLWIPRSYLAEHKDDGSAAVYAADGQDQLQLLPVTLGAYDDQTGCYEILSGLEADAFVADPAADGCKAGAPVIYRDAADFGGDPVPAESEA